MKKILLSLVATVMLISSLTACGSEKLKTIDVEKTVEEISENCGFSYMTYTSEEDIDIIFDFSSTSYKDIISYRAMDPVIGDEIAIVEANSKDDVKAIIDILKDRAKSKSQTFGGYAPIEAEKADKAEIISQGNYVLLAICEDTSKAVEAFEKAFEK